MIPHKDELSGAALNNVESENIVVNCDESDAGLETIPVNEIL